MDAKRKFTADKYEYAIDGSSARKLVHSYDYAEAAPAEVPDVRIQPQVQPRVNPGTSTRPERAPQPKPAKRLAIGHGIDFISMCMLCIAMTVTIITCVQHLKARSEYTQLKKEIVALEQQVASITKENDAEYTNISSNIDLDYIYQTAVGKLGMVFPNNNSVMYYEYVTDGYVRQYDTIPEASNDFSLDELFGK